MSKDSKTKKHKKASSHKNRDVVDVKTMPDDGTCKLMNDTIAKQVEAVWKQAFKVATMLPVLGVPSTANGVMTLTHGMDTNDGMTMPMMSINGLVSKSPLANNALFSAECVDGKYLNLYEIMLPDMSSSDGSPSSSQIYINELGKQGLDVTATHYHWLGAKIYDNDRGVTAVHHMKVGMNPIEFSNRTIAALNVVMKVITDRS